MSDGSPLSPARGAAAPPRLCTQWCPCARPAAAFGDVYPPLPSGLVAALAAGGVERLWSHQAAGLTAVRAGENVLVTTPTASGKSLIFQLPVLEEAAAGGAGRALFLYPLKALGQDQRSKLEELAMAAGIDAAVRLARIASSSTLPD